MIVKELRELIDDFPDYWDVKVRIGDVGFDLSPLNIGAEDRQMRLIFVKKEE